MAERGGSLPDRLPSRLRPPGVSGVVAGLAGLAGVAAAGVAIGVAAAHRAAVGGATDRPPLPDRPRTTPGVGGRTGGGPTGSQRPLAGESAADWEASTGQPYVVTTRDGLTLHVEVDEHQPDRADAESAAPSTSGASHPQGPHVADTPLPTVVLVHGYALDCRIWHRQRRDLSRRTRVVSFDQRGHGRSDVPGPGGYTLDDLAADLLAVLDQVVGDGPVVVVAHSMGGMTLLALAAAHPELFGPRVRGVALVCTSAGVPADLVLPGSVGGFGPLWVLSGAAAAVHRSASRTSQYATGVLLTLAAGLPTLTSHTRTALRSLENALTRSYSFAVPMPPEIVRFVGTVMTATPVAVVAALYPAIVQADLWSGVHALLGLPVLVVTADRDRLMPPAHGRALAARLPDARLLALAPAGHLAFLEYPELVDAELGDLLDQASR